MWNELQARAFDLSGSLPSDSVLGTLLSAFLGYQETPTVGAVLIYVVFLVPALVLFFAPVRPLRTPRHA